MNNEELNKEIEEAALEAYCTPYGKANPSTYAFIAGALTALTDESIYGKAGFVKMEWISGDIETEENGFYLCECQIEGNVVVRTGKFHKGDEYNASAWIYRHYDINPIRWTKIPTPPLNK